MPKPDVRGGPHGATALPDADVVSYNLELKDEEGFIGDRASKRAFTAILEEARQQLRETGEDPLGDRPTAEFSKKQLDRILLEGSPVEAGLVHGAIEEFAQKLAGVIRRYLRLKTWRDTKRIAVGGGLRQSRIGELAIGRAGVILKSERFDVDLTPIHYHPDHAGLVGAAFLSPRWMFSGHDALLAVDIGGTNIRCGIVTLNQQAAPDLSEAEVWKSELWRHADETARTRDAAVARIAEMLEGLIAEAGRKKIGLAPFLGIGCPGVIRPDGSIEKGAQNLPGNWESSTFFLPDRLAAAIPPIDGHPLTVVMHNDAVVQGLSEVPRMREVPHWAVVTIGTGLGNASFRTTAAPPAAAKDDREEAPRQPQRAPA